MTRLVLLLISSRGRLLFHRLRCSVRAGERSCYSTLSRQCAQSIWEQQGCFQAWVFEWSLCWCSVFRIRFLYLFISSVIGCDILMERLKLQKHNLATRMKQTIDCGTFSWHALLLKIGLWVKALFVTPTSSTYVNWYLAWPSFKEACFEQERRQRSFGGCWFYPALWKVLRMVLSWKMQLCIRLLSEPCQLSDGNGCFYVNHRFLK